MLTLPVQIADAVLVLQCGRVHAHQIWFLTMQKRKVCLQHSSSASSAVSAFAWTFHASGGVCTRGIDFQTPTQLRNRP